ncbi:hypothetical protein POM88_050353 [Heracleum sosnowskyi]|uniref:Ubiquitin-like protease family profile domain-containing protein n=1 Tax=Heracleum sosnowskyi TaxID=360622 RepID=A0AAD8GXF3_9APIA|nr:hypothetical protein POM88_050353 [Heracleum sosnowskyi]
MKRRLSSLCVDPMWFYLYMNKERDYKEDVVNWMLRDKILTKGYVYIPICHSNHWNLLILCNIGESMESNTKSPCMFLLDSLHKREKDMEPTIRKFVSHLYKNREKREQEEVLNITYKVPKVPQHKDASKCGYYVLYFIYRFVLDSPDDFNINNDYPGFMTEDWFTQDDFDSFCQNLSDICKTPDNELPNVVTKPSIVEEGTYEATAWLRNMVGARDFPAKHSEEEFRLALRDGLILCNLLNKIVIGTVPKVVEAQNVYTQIAFFLVYVEDMRLPTFYLSNLEEGGNYAKIFDCLLALKSYNDEKQGSGKDSEPFTNFFSKNMLENDSISSNLCPDSDSTKMIPKGNTEDCIQVINLSSDVKTKLKFVSTKKILTVARRSPHLYQTTAEIIDIHTSGSLTKTRKVHDKSKSPERWTSARLTKGDTSSNSDADMRFTNDIEKTPPPKSHIQVIHVDMTTSSLNKKRKKSGKCDTPARRTSTRLAKSNILSDFDADPTASKKSAKMSKDDESEIDFDQLLVQKLRRSPRKMPEKKSKTYLTRNSDDDSDFAKSAKEKSMQTKKRRVPEKNQRNRRKASKKLQIRLFTDAVNQMSKAQKKWVYRAGFEHLLSFSMKMIPKNTAINVVWWFDYDNLWLNLSDNRIIRVTEEDVHEILGFPRGKMDIKMISNEDRLATWRSQFDEDRPGHKITEKMIFRAITRSTEVNLQFKQNCMILMMNFFIRCIKNSYVSQEVLGFVGNFDNAAKFNWCKLVIQGLKRGSKLWIEDPETQYYTGSLMFLIFFYLDRVNNAQFQVERTSPAFLGWKNSLIIQRDGVEDLDNSFGEGDIEQDFELPKNSIEDGINCLTDNDLDEEHVEVFEDKSVAHMVIEVQNEGTCQDDTKNAHKNFENSQQFHTPRETIKGVDSCQRDFNYDDLNSGIMSIAQDINNENVVFTLLKKCRSKLAMARAYFPTNPDVKDLEDEFARLHKSPIIGKPVQESDPGEFSNKGKGIVEALDFQDRPKREHKVGDLQKSPFRERVIDIDKPKLTKVEEDIWNWLNRNNLYPMQELFCWNYNTCRKHELQTLQSNRKLYSGVVDTYACILNEEEKHRSPDSPHGFFYSTYNTVGALTGINEFNIHVGFVDVKYERFRSNLDSILGKHLVDISNVDLVVFPIHYINHFYVICFNLKNPAVEILDNNKIGGDSTTIYDGLPESLRENFIKYIMNVSEAKARQLHNVPIMRLQMKWRTRNNNIDCGVFAIRHMETYKGNGVRNCESKLSIEGVRKNLNYVYLFL